MQIAPYLKFNDVKCREAMNFYHTCLGGELTISTVGESPMAKEMPDEAERVMHAMLKGDGFEFYASDMMRDKAIVGDNVSVCINVTDEAKAHAIFDALSEGGEVFMPLEKAFWGDIFGVTTDKFGIEWMVNCSTK